MRLTTITVALLSLAIVVIGQIGDDCIPCAMLNRRAIPGTDSATCPGGANCIITQSQPTELGYWELGLKPRYCSSVREQTVKEVAWVTPCIVTTQPMRGTFC
ncbi:hypothetical protein BC629DRAFT_1439831 [Irpex lacteus]|nr:hypothetical protein BC629DRAFT_1439831 [Irpex lacteus]